MGVKVVVVVVVVVVFVVAVADKAFDLETIREPKALSSR